MTTVEEDAMEGSEVVYRSSSDLTKKTGHIRMHPDIKHLPIIEPTDDSKKPDFSKVLSVKSKEYQQGHSTQFAIVVICPSDPRDENSEEVQYAVIFAQRDVRDMWFRCFLERPNRAWPLDRKQFADPELRANPWTVQKLDLKDPLDAGKDCAVWLRITMCRLGEAPKVDDIMLEKRNSNTVVKDRVRNFQYRHDLLPTEGSSLYRLAKSLLLRDRVKEEAQSVIDKIESLHVDRSTEDPDTLSMAEMDQVLAHADKELEALKGSLTSKFGDGTGPRILDAVLKQNIEKLRVINKETVLLRKMLR